MKEDPLPILIQTPIILKQCFFTETDRGSSWIDEGRMASYVERLQLDLGLYLRQLDLDEKEMPAHKINLILNEWVIKMMLDNKGYLKKEIDLLRLIVLRGEVEVSIHSELGWLPPMNNRAIEYQLECFEELFDCRPKKYFCPQRKYHTGLLAELKDAGIENIYLIDDRSITFDEVSNKNLTTEVDKLLGLGEIVKVLQVIDLYSSQLAPTMSNSIGEYMNGRFSSEIQKAAWESLVRCAKSVEFPENDALSDQVRLLFQEYNFTVMDTRASSNYTSQNPYDSPYLAYINFMNLVELFKRRMDQNMIRSN